MQDWQKFVTVTFDEVKVREDLVYDKSTAQLIGFANLGNVIDQTEAIGTTTHSKYPPLATHMLVFMVRGVFIDLEFPYAQYATSHTSAGSIYPVVWDVIRHLELAGIKVICVTCDGVSANRAFFKMHREESKMKSGVVYKCTNPIDGDRDVYFMSDVPHLIKTTRNCWSHSFAHRRTRQLWVIKKLYNYRSLLLKHYNAYVIHSIPFNMQNNGKWIS